MISVAEAERIIAANTGSLPAEKVLYRLAIGHVLRESVRADRDLPPFDRVMMDGVALSSKDWESGVRQFRVLGVQAAGVPPATLEERGGCLEIMTGAVMAEGCDCIVPYEELRIEGGVASIVGDFHPTPGQFIHRRGSDFSAGEELVAPGVRLSAKEIAVTTSCGVTELLVTRPVRVGIVSTGDELVPVEAEVGDHQIRQSNNFALEAALNAMGIENVTNVHIADDPRLIEATLEELMESATAVLLSGGISKGKFDHVPRALEKLGVKKLFQGVLQRPGKPFWYGRSAAGGTAVFALPGNPLSTLTCFHRYVVPALEEMLGLKASTPVWVALKEPFVFYPPFTFFLPVIAGSSESGVLAARPHPARNSGDFASIVPTSGFVELPAEDRNEFPEGYTARYYRWL